MLGLGPSALSFKAPMCLAPTLTSPLSPLGLGGVVAYHPVISLALSATLLMVLVSPRYVNTLLTS